MKKTTLLLVLLLFGKSVVFAQVDSLAIKELQKQIEHLETHISELQTEQSKVLNLSNEINGLRSQIKRLSEENTEFAIKSDTMISQLVMTNTKIGKLKNDINLNSQSISKTEEELGLRLKTSEDKSKEQFTVLHQSLSSKTLWGIIGFLIAIILLVTIYFLLYRKQKSDRTDVEASIQETKKSLEEESLKLDTKLMEVLNKQLKIEQVKSESKSEEKDHSLVLKVADEVTRILMNLEVMDKSIRGYKHLKKYSSSILDNLKAYGYEIPELLGKNYSTGMNMVVTMEFDDSIEEGKEIIKRVIKPQVDYNGKMIQAAKVIVAFNE